MNGFLNNGNDSDSDNEGRKKRKGKGGYCRALLAFLVLAAVLAGIVSALKEPARAQQFNGYRRVPFGLPGMVGMTPTFTATFPTLYAPYLQYTNNGTNSGFSIPVTATVTNSTVLNLNPANSLYIGNDWLPSTPVLLVMGVTEVSGGSGDTFSNGITLSPDNNYFTPAGIYGTNGIMIGGTLLPGTTNWFTYLVPAGWATNMAYANWCWTASSGGTDAVVSFYYQVIK